MNKNMSNRFIAFIIGVCCLLIVMVSIKIVNLTQEVTSVGNCTIQIESKNEKIVKQYIKDLESIDSGLLTICNSIVFTDEHVDVAAGNDEIYNEAIGYTSTADRTIYINTDTYNSTVLTHEFFHLIDSYKSNPIKSHSSEFKKLVTNYKEVLKLSSYELSSEEETFAGVLLRWRYPGYNGADLSQSPLLYEYVANIMKPFRV